MKFIAIILTICLSQSAHAQHVSHPVLSLDYSGTPHVGAPMLLRVQVRDEDGQLPSGWGFVWTRAGLTLFLRLPGMPQNGNVDMIVSYTPTMSDFILGNVQWAGAWSSNSGPPEICAASATIPFGVLAGKR